MQIINPEAFRRAQMIAATDDSRFNINGVFCQVDGTIVATDGHLLFIHPGVLQDVTAPTLLRFDKPIPKNCGNVNINADAEGLTAIMTAKVRTKDYAAKVDLDTNTTYPDYKALFKDYKNTAHTTFKFDGGGTLSKLIKAAPCMITFQPGQDAHGMFTLTFGDMPKASGAIMGCRL